MLGIGYVILNFLLGMEVGKVFFLSGRNQKTGKQEIWVLLASAYGIGTLLMGWMTYLTAYFASVCLGSERPLFWGNLATMTVTAAGLCVLYLKRVKASGTGKQKEENIGIQPLHRKKVCLETVFFVGLFVFLTWIMFYVFHIKDGVLYSGFTVYGDYAPHTAMMRSFSMQDNFPTQYPHFGGEDVKYHFMFQFLAGNLEYLGLRMDLAYNLISVLSLEGFLMLLYSVGKRITGSCAVGAVTIVLFFFRSAFTFFRFAWEHIQAGDLWKTLTENTSFIGYTPNEDWGLWNFNVYLNQRHLAFGLLLVGIAVWMYLDWLEESDSRSKRGLVWLKDCFFCRKAWKVREPERAMAAGILLGLGTFWNGAAVIGGLLILAGFGLFSLAKLDYAITAVITVFFSLLETKIFIRGAAMEPAFYWGFLAEDKSVFGVLSYLLSMSGIFFAGLLVLIFFLNRKQRILTFSFCLPGVFAFCVSLTPDINVNHKYLMISYAFLAIFWAWAAVKLCRKALVGRLAAGILVLALTVSGIYDFVVILKDNDQNHRVGIQMESDLTRWLAENLDQRDLLLTPEYSMSETTMAGVMLYCGWPYYAWSAGYDTNYRAAQATEIYTTENQEQLQRLVKKEKITYILFEEGMTFEQHPCREDVIAQTYPLVYNSEDGRIRIYET